MSTESNRREFLQAGISVLAHGTLVSQIPRVNQQSTLPFVVVFEVEPTKEGFDTYLQMAKELRRELEGIPGFVSIERSRSLRSQTKLLSLSYWADEAAIANWRSRRRHHEAQHKGRKELFSNYRLRVGQVIREWTRNSDVETAQRTIYNTPPYHDRQYMALLRTETSLEQERLQALLREAHLEGGDVEHYQSLVHPTRYFTTLPVQSESEGSELNDRVTEFRVANRSQPVTDQRLQIIEVERDYGRFERAQAPQYFSEISSGEEKR